jgi:hypothetical protein
MSANASKPQNRKRRELEPLEQPRNRALETTE